MSVPLTPPPELAVALRAFRRDIGDELALRVIRDIREECGRGGGEMPPELAGMLADGVSSRETLLHPVHGGGGAIVAVDCRAADWIRHGQALMAWNPIMRVELLDCAPHYGDWTHVNADWREAWSWCEPLTDGLRPRSALPSSVWRLTPKAGSLTRNAWTAYRTRDIAMDAASHGCIAMFLTPQERAEMLAEWGMRFYLGPAAAMTPAR